MCRVSTMSTLKACSAVLAAILVLANTSTAQDFFNEHPKSSYDYERNERPKSSYDYERFFNHPGTPPSRRPRPDPEPEFNADPFWRYPKLYGPRSFRPSMLRTLQDGGGGGAGGEYGGEQQVILMHHIHLVYIMSKQRATSRFPRPPRSCRSSLTKRSRHWRGCRSG